MYATSDTGPDEIPQYNIIENCCITTIYSLYGGILTVTSQKHNVVSNHRRLDWSRNACRSLDRMYCGNSALLTFWGRIDRWICHTKGQWRENVLISWRHIIIILVQIVSYWIAKSSHPSFPMDLVNQEIKQIAPLKFRNGYNLLSHIL